MAYTTEDLAAVDRALVALASGERVSQVRLSDRLVQYQEVDAGKLTDLRAAIVRELGTVRVPLAGRTWKVAQSGKGL